MRGTRRRRRRSPGCARPWRVTVVIVRRSETRVKHSPDSINRPGGELFTLWQPRPHSGSKAGESAKEGRYYRALDWFAVLGGALGSFPLALIRRGSIYARENKRRRRRRRRPFDDSIDYPARTLLAPFRFVFVLFFFSPRCHANGRLMSHCSPRRTDGLPRSFACVMRPLYSKQIEIPPTLWH